MAGAFSLRIQHPLQGCQGLGVHFAPLSSACGADSRLRCGVPRLGGRHTTRHTASFSLLSPTSRFPSCLKLFLCAGIQSVVKPDPTSPSLVLEVYACVTGLDRSTGQSARKCPRQAVVSPTPPGPAVCLCFVTRLQLFSDLFSFCAFVPSLRPPPAAPAARTSAERLTGVRAAVPTAAVGHVQGRHATPQLNYSPA